MIRATEGRKEGKQAGRFSASPLLRFTALRCFAPTHAFRRQQKKKAREALVANKSKEDGLRPFYALPPTPYAYALQLSFLSFCVFGGGGD